MTISVLPEILGQVAECLGHLRRLLSRTYFNEEEQRLAKDHWLIRACASCVECIDRSRERLLEQLGASETYEIASRSYAEEWAARLARYLSEDLYRLRASLSELEQGLGLYVVAQEANQWGGRAAKLSARASIEAAIGLADHALGIFESRLTALGRMYSQTNSPAEVIPGEDVEIDSVIAAYNYWRPQDIFQAAPAPSERLQFPSAAPSPEKLQPVAHWFQDVFFVTDRAKAIESSSTRAIFSDGRHPNAKPTYGIAEISIPRGHRRGKIERPSLWKLQFRENPEKHIVVSSCDEKSVSSWKSLAKQHMNEGNSDAALIFIHGFNVSFDDAIRNAAQLGFDLQFGGLVVAFSWSSEGKVLQYATDVSNARLSAPRFANFLRLLRSDIGVKSVNIIAHSMGNVVLIEALKAMRRAKSGNSIVDEVVFAAPDYDADELRGALGTLAGKARRYTLYGSENDRALLASKRLRNDYPRAGDGGRNLLVLNGVETIDASSVGSDLLGLGHSYFSSKISLLSDIHYVIKERLPPWRRDGLREFVLGPLKYWIFQP